MILQNILLGTSYIGRIKLSIGELLFRAKGARRLHEVKLIQYTKGLLSRELQI